MSGNPLQDLGLQDIARIDGWVKVARSDPGLPLGDEDDEDDEDDEVDEDETPSDSDELDSDESHSPESPGSEQQSSDSSGVETYQHASASEQLPEEVERLPDNVLEYDSSPISARAVPIFPIALQADDPDEFEVLGSEFVEAESAWAESAEAELAEADSVTGSDDVDSISTDIEEEEEASLLMAEVSVEEMCLYVYLPNHFCVSTLLQHAAASSASP